MLPVLVDFKQYPHHTCYMEPTRAQDMETTSEGNGAESHEVNMLYLCHYRLHPPPVACTVGPLLLG